MISDDEYSQTRNMNTTVQNQGKEEERTKNIFATSQKETHQYPNDGQPSAAQYLSSVEQIGEASPLARQQSWGQQQEQNYDQYSVESAGTAGLQLDGRNTTNHTSNHETVSSAFAAAKLYFMFAAFTIALVCSLILFIQFNKLLVFFVRDYEQTKSHKKRKRKQFVESQLNTRKIHVSNETMVNNTENSTEKEVQNKETAIGEEKVEEGCSICLTAFNDGDEIGYSQHPLCLHTFHRKCILSWLISHTECPLCRLTFLTQDRSYIPENNDGGSSRTLSNDELLELQVREIIGEESQKATDENGSGKNDGGCKISLPNDELSEPLVYEEIGKENKIETFENKYLDSNGTLTKHELCEI